MPLPKSNTYTINDIYALPEGQRAELIDGQIYDMAPPSPMHQKLVYQLSRTIGNYIEKNYVEPDISVICDKNKISNRGCEGAPDFVIEIVSPSSRKMDYSTKNALYADSKVREYWIVDPARERTTVYRYEDDVAPIIIPFNDYVKVGIYGDLKICIADLLK